MPAFLQNWSREAQAFVALRDAWAAGVEPQFPWAWRFERVPPTHPETGAPLPPPRRIILRDEAAAPGVMVPVWRPAPPKAKGKPAGSGGGVVALHPGAAQEPGAEAAWLSAWKRQQREERG